MNLLGRIEGMEEFAGVGHLNVELYTLSSQHLVAANPHSPTYEHGKLLDAFGCPI